MSRLRSGVSAPLKAPSAPLSVPSAEILVVAAASRRRIGAERDAFSAETSWDTRLLISSPEPTPLAWMPAIASLLSSGALAQEHDRLVVRQLSQAQDLFTRDLTDQIAGLRISHAANHATARAVHVEFELAADALQEALQLLRNRLDVHGRRRLLRLDRCLHSRCLHSRCLPGRCSCGLRVHCRRHCH